MNAPTAQTRNGVSPEHLQRIAADASNIIELVDELSGLIEEELEPVLHAAVSALAQRIGIAADKALLEANLTPRRGPAEAWLGYVRQEEARSAPE